MPLPPGQSVSKSIHELVHNGSKPRSHEQIVAIAEHVKHQKKAPAISNPNGKKEPGVKMEPGAKIMHASGASGADG